MPATRAQVGQHGMAHVVSVELARLLGGHVVHQPDAGDGRRRPAEGVTVDGQLGIAVRPDQQRLALAFLGRRLHDRADHQAVHHPDAASGIGAQLIEQRGRENGAKLGCGVSQVGADDQIEGAARPLGPALLQSGDDLLRYDWEMLRKDGDRRQVGRGDCGSYLIGLIGR